MPNKKTIFFESRKINTFKKHLDIYYTRQKILTLFILSFLILPITSTNLQNKFTQDIESNKPQFDEMQTLLSKTIPKINPINDNLASTVSALNLIGKEFSEAKIIFGSLNNFFSFSLRGKSQDFMLANNSRPLLITSSNKNDMMIFTKYLKPNKGIEFNGHFKIRSVNQWKLVFEEDFSESVSGWSKNILTECGGVKMLGGYCQFGSGEVLKTIEKLPEHKQLRIEATFHFIDAWHGESGFMRLNNGKDKEMQYAWIENYNSFEGANGINVCGGHWPEGKFSVPINFSIPHKDDSIKIGFGSTTEQDACDQSFGVSGIRIYIR